MTGSQNGEAAQDTLATYESRTEQLRRIAKRHEPILARSVLRMPAGFTSQVADLALPLDPVTVVTKFQREHNRELAAWYRQNCCQLREIRHTRPVLKYRFEPSCSGSRSAWTANARMPLSNWWARGQHRGKRKSNSRVPRKDCTGVVSLECDERV
eukprot:2310040-Rhodomonas_salina.3